MKICQLMAADTRGGLGKHLVDLSNGLAAHADVTVIAHPNYAGKFSERVEHIPLDMTRSRVSPLPFLKLLRILRRLDPDVIHAHGNRAATFLARLRGFVPGISVGTIHWHLRKPRNRQGFERLDGVIGVSFAVLSPLSNPVREVVYNGVPLDTPTLGKSELCARYGLADDRPLALAIGRMVRGKGFDLLLKAWVKQDANLLLVGDGPMAARLKSLRAELELDSKVAFSGFVPAAASMIHAADIVVIPSLAEGFSYVLAEALTRRKPVIATSGVSGARELLSPDLLIPPGDVAALGTAISGCMADLKSYDLKLQSLYDWAGERLSLEAMVRANLDFYRKVREPVRTN